MLEATSAEAAVLTPRGRLIELQGDIADAPKLQISPGSPKGRGQRSCDRKRTHSGVGFSEIPDEAFPLMDPEDSTEMSDAVSGKLAPWFSEAVGTIVILNMIVMGLETEIHSPYWRAVECVFAVVYVSEISHYLRRYGWELYLPLTHEVRGEMVLRRAAIMSMFDTLLAILAMMNVSCICVLQLPISEWMFYTRMARGIRVFFLFDALGRFALAIGSMLSTLTWIFSVLALIIYFIAVVLTYYAQNNISIETTNREYFSTVATTMFTLFQVTTLDSWPEAAGPLLEQSVWWRVFFVVFIAFSSWTMISLVTAVVSDNVIQTTANNKEKQSEIEARRKQDFITFLQQSFEKADADGNGVLDHEEFDELIMDPKVLDKMEALGIEIPIEDLRQAFDMLDIDESGELTIQEFIEGVSQLQESLNTRHVVSLDYSLQRVQKKVSKKIDSLEETIKEGNNTLAKSIDELC